MSSHNRIITPATDPDRFTEDEAGYFRAGKCGWVTGYGLPWTEHCGAPSKPGASFGNCAEHDAELMEEFYPDGTRRPFDQAAANRAHVRALLAQNQPAYAAALETVHAELAGKDR